MLQPQRDRREHERPDERSDRTENELHIDDNSPRPRYVHGMDLVTVATFADLPEAELCKQRLASEHVEAFVLHGNTNSLMPFLTAGEGGIHVQVKAEDAGRAKEILGS